MFPFLVAALFVVSLGYGILAPTLPEFAARAGLSSDSVLWIAYSSYSFAKITAQIPSGYFVDRLGPKPILRGALLLYVVAMASMTAKLPTAGFVMTRVAEGLAEGAVYPAVLKMIRASAPPGQMGRRIGLALGLGSSGILIGPVAGALLARAGFVQVTSITALMGGAVLLAELLLGKSTLPTAVAPDTGTSTRERLLQLRDLVVNRRLVRIGLPVAFNKLMTTGFFAMFPLIVAQRFGGDKLITAVFFLVAGLSFVAAQAVGGWLADKFPLRVLLRVYAPVVLIATAGLAFAESPYFFGALLFVQTLVQTCILLASLREVASGKQVEDQFGGVFGALATATDLFTIVGPALALILYATFKMNAFIVLAAIGIGVYLIRYLIGVESAKNDHLPRPH